MKEIIPYLLVLIPFLPLGASLVNALCFYRVSQKPSKSLNYATAFISIFALIGVLLSYIVIAVFHPHLNSDLSATIIEGGQWFASSSVKFNFSLRYDALTQLMILIVVVVGLMVHIFSVGYLGDRVEDFARYFSWLSFFMFSMLLLVLASNLTLVFLAWEAVGLSSYKLISFYVERKDAQKAGQKAFIINRIGDAAFLLAIFALIQLCSSTEFSDIYRVFESNPLAQKYAGFIGLCIFFAAAAKSAQLPLFTWLPSAMTGPTPVSALIHAATMVTAGVFLILRMQPIYYHSPEASNIVAFAGALTALTGAVIASTQIDIKKILAYSTVSQLGFMVTALGVGAYSASLFHLFTHAFFKALLFLGAGAVITYLHHEQNIRKMGGLAKSYPLLALCFWIGLLSLSGIPGFSGFFSKDHILLSSYAAIRGGELLFTLLTLTTGLTAFYSFRAGILVFHGESRVEKSTIHHADHKPGISFYFPLILLSIFAVVAGLWGVPALLTGYAPALFEYLDRNWAMQADRTSTAFMKTLSHSTEWSLMAITLAATLIGLLIAVVRYKLFKQVPHSEGAYRGLFTLFSFKRLLVDEIYFACIVQPLKKMGDAASRFETHTHIALSEGLGTFTQALAHGMVLIQNGRVSDYLLYMLMGVVALIVFIYGGITL